MAAERTVVVRIKAEYRAFEASMKAAARSAEQASQKIEKSGKKSSSALGQLLLDAKQHDQAWGQAGGAMLGFGASLVGMVAVSVAKYAAFDKAMSRVQAATHESKGNMDLLREAAIKAGADTAFSAEEAAAGIEELAKAGVSTKDILAGGLNGALSLAAAGELAVADAAEIAASALTQFKLSGDQIPHLADLLAAGAGKAQGSVTDLGAALNQSGLVAASTGLSIEETSGALAAFASAGLTGSDAGTSFKTMLQSLNPNSKAAANLMDDLGIHAYDAEGAFIGMSEYAGVLQGALKDMSAEQRNATMKTLFGSDAVRAANILYEQGAEGIREWEDSVNAAGYAAQTAAIMQDNLAGDVEKLGGAFDTVFIKAGGGVNDVLRQLTQGAEGMVDALGRVSPEALSTVASITGIVGVSALAAGAFMTLAPKAIETWTAFRSLGTEGGKIPGALGKITKAAVIAGAALAALQIIGELISTEHAKSATDYAEALQKIAKAGTEAGNSQLDSLFDSFDTVAGAKRAGEVRDLAGAVGELANPSKMDSLNKGLNFLNGWFNLPSDKLTLLEGRLSDFSDTMGEMVTAGDMESPAEAFRVISDEFIRNGESAQTAMESLPGYRDALKEVALAQGVAATDGELLVWAMDGIAPAAVTAAQNSNAVADGLAEMGVSADGAVESLDKLLDSLLAAGLATMSSKEMSFKWADSLRDTKKEIEEILKTQGKLGPALSKDQKDFNDSTDSGYAALQLFNSKLREGTDVAKQFASDTTKSQADVQKQLESTYNAGVKTAEGFGMSKEAAVALTRETLQIPPNVDIKTWIDSVAETGAQEIKAAVEGIPKMTNVKVIATDNGSVAVTKEQIASIRGRTVATQVTDEGTILTVQGGINNIEGTTEQILVNDNGTVTVVQSQINKVTGKQEFIKVTDGGTVAGVQAKINAIADGYAQVRVTTIHSTEHVSTGVGGRGGITRATGGSVFGAGTETSDSIPAWLSNNEHVLSAKEVRGLGGHGAVERLRAEARMGNAPAFKNGGRVSTAEKKVTSLKHTYEKIDGKKENRSRKLAAKWEYEAAKKELAAIKKGDKKAEAAAKKAETARKKAAEDEKARQQRLSEGRFDLRTEARRGTVTDAFASGGGMSYVDKMFDASNNKDLSKKQRANMRSLAYSTERELLKLEKRSESLEKKIDKAVEARDRLLSARDGARDQITGAFDLGGMLGQKDAYGYSKHVGKKGLLAYGKSLAAGAKTLSQKVKELQKRGFNESMINQVIDEWTNSGTFELANGMLEMNKGERASFNQSFKDLGTYGTRTGNSLTEAMAKGGLNAAQTLVSTLGKEEKNVEKAFYDLGKAGQKGFHRAWGIASPAKEAKKDAKHIVDGSVLGIMAEAPRFTAAMAGMYESPAFSVPPSAEVARYAAQPAAAGFQMDYDKLAQAMSKVQLVSPVNIDRNTAGRLVQIGSQQAARLK